MHQPNRPRLRVGSLFSGYGGLDLAVEQVFDADTIWYAENDPAVAAVYQTHWPDAMALGDITRIDWAKVPPVDVICGGFPCQDLSCSGARQGMGEGTRSGLWSSMADAIRVLKPRWVVVENVTGLLSTPAHLDTTGIPADLEGDLNDINLTVRSPRPSHRNVDGPVVRGLGVVLADLAHLGFDAAWACLPASHAEACHQRRRVFILAWPAAADPVRV